MLSIPKTTSFGKSYKMFMKTKNKLNRIILILITFPLLLANGRVPSVPMGNVTEPIPSGEPVEAEPATSPPPASQETPPIPASVWGMGQLWAGVSQQDTGHCPGYGMPSGYGVRPSLVRPVVGGVHPERGFRVGHTGVDILAPDGSPVKAAAAGTVIWAGVSAWCGTGCNVVAVSHGGGWYTLYFHLAVVTVSCGQGVGTGDVVGLTGRTGSSNFAHLHFELRNGHWSFAPLPQ